MPLLGPLSAGGRTSGPCICIVDLNSNGKNRRPPPLEHLRRADRGQPIKHIFVCRGRADACHKTSMNIFSDNETSEFATKNSCRKNNERDPDRCRLVYGSTIVDILGMTTFTVCFIYLCLEHVCGLQRRNVHTVSNNLKST